MRIPAQLRSFAAYGLAIVLMKGFALVTIPLVASHLAPAEYGELDLSVSLIEFVSLFCTFGLAEVLYRFCGGAAPEDRQRLRELAGAALVSAAIAAALVQVAAPFLYTLSGLRIDRGVFHLALAAASLTALVELPLAYLRLRDWPMMFLGFVLGRTLLQTLLMWLLLSRGMGPEGVLIANAAVQFLLAGTLTFVFVKNTGLSLSSAMARNLAFYGFPLVLSGVTMFALGSADRWFLAGAVSREELAHYAIATKLALATALLIQPLGLWWYPRRLSILREHGGIDQNRRVWGVGLAILAGGGAMINMAMPVFVGLLLPQDYAPALAFLPWLTLVFALNELVSLSNAGAYLGRSSWIVLAVNASAAVLVVALYFAAAPRFGVAGAIGATLAAQSFRLVAFSWISRKSAPPPLFSPRTPAILAASLLPWALLPADASLPVVAAAMAATFVLAGAAALLRPASLGLAAARLRHA